MNKQRAIAAIAWMVVTFVYLAVCAENFTGLYRLVAEFQLRHFGSYRTTGSFIAPLFVLWLPLRLIAPNFWRRPLESFQTTSATPAPTPVQRSRTEPPVARTQLVRRGWSNWKIALAVIGASFIGVAGWVGITLALHWKELNAPYHADVTTIDLARNQPFRPDAYLVVVVGEAQPDYMIALTKRFQGEDTRTAFIPLTAPGWTPRQPIRVIRRKKRNADEPWPFGRGVDRHVRTDTLRIDGDGVPGIVRAGLEEKGATLASDVIVIYDRFD